MLRVGLTGGIAAGKSEVSRRLAELGAVVVDHDVLARAVVAPGSPGLAQVAEEFGDQVLGADGALDRAALARTVFGDESARGRLNAIVHPLVRRAAAEAEHEARTAGARVVVHDIPLLVETGQEDGFDVVVVVDAPADLRAQRMVQTRGSSLEDARARIEAQAGDAERRAAADEVLDGSGDVAGLRAQVDAMWARWAEGGRR